MLHLFQFLLTRGPSYGFIKYYNFKDAENCIRGFHYLGYEVSFARVCSTRSEKHTILTKTGILLRQAQEVLRRIQHQSLRFEHSSPHQRSRTDLNLPSLQGLLQQNPP